MYSIFFSLTVIKKVFMAVFMWGFVLKIISTEQISVELRLCAFVNLKDRIDRFYKHATGQSVFH